VIPKPFTELEAKQIDIKVNRWIHVRAFSNSRPRPNSKLKIQN
jgi:hypothetical protein